MSRSTVCPSSEGLTFISKKCYKQEITLNDAELSSEYENSLTDIVNLQGGLTYGLTLSNTTGVSVGNAPSNNLRYLDAGTNESVVYTLTFNKSVDIELGFESLLAGEFLTVLTPDYFRNGGTGTANPDEFHNGNSNNPFFIRWKNVTEVKFSLNQNVNVGAWQIAELIYDAEYSIACYLEESGAEIFKAFEGKEEITVPYPIPADWERIECGLIAPVICPHFDAELDLIGYHPIGIPIPLQGDLGALVPPDVNKTINNLPVGDSDVFDLEFIGDEDRPILVEMKVTNLVGGNHAITQNNINGGFGHLNGGRYELEFTSKSYDKCGEALPFSLAIRLASFQGGSERWWADGTSTVAQELTPVDEYINWNGAVATYPTTGIFSTGGNDQRPRTIGYQNKTSVIAQWQSQDNVGSSFYPWLYEGSELIDYPVCERVDELSKKAGELQDQIDECTKKVYSWEITAGVTEEIWDAAGNAAPHADIDSIFTGETHVNGAPDLSQTVADWIDDNADFPNNGADQLQYKSWIYIPQDGTVLSDVNANTGEKIRVFINGSVVYLNNTETAAGSTGAGAYYTANKGWLYQVFQIADGAAFGGVQLQADGVNFAGLTSTTKPKLLCRDEPCDYILQEGEMEECQFLTEVADNALLPEFTEVLKHPDVGYALCGEIDNLNNGSVGVGGTGNANEVSHTFTPHATGDYKITYISDSIVGGATPTSGMTIRELGGADVYVTAPATGDADGARLSPQRLENFVTVALTEGVEYEILRWAGGGSYAQGNTTCIAEVGIANYVATIANQEQPTILTSPNGAQYQLSVDNSGGLVTTAI